MLLALIYVTTVDRRHRRRVTVAEDGGDRTPTRPAHEPFCSLGMAGGYSLALGNSRHRFD
jgi:hypothetical protein